MAKAEPQSQAKSLPLETARNRSARVTTGAQLARSLTLKDHERHRAKRRFGSTDLELI
jgi:hypothetical protein